ncbi:hypothetical protein K525DRAFT_214319, partial [Schizophyllum commune Loenen D]
QQSNLTVATMFCSVGTMPSTAVMCCCSRASVVGVAGMGNDGSAAGGDVGLLGALSGTVSPDTARITVSSR